MQKDDIDKSSPIYMAGNLAPEEDPYERRRREEQRKELEQNELKERTKAYAKKRSSYSFFQFFPIFLLILVFLALCIRLLQVEYFIYDAKKNIKAKESEYIQLVQDNKAKEMSLEKSIDMNEIYEKAINELGMVYPEEGQIIIYDKKESGYVRQYEDIP